MYTETLSCNNGIINSFIIFHTKSDVEVYDILLLMKDNNFWGKKALEKYCK